MMADPHFRHTILYLSHHSAEEGALGFILNRPLAKKAGDLPIGEAADHISHVKIYEGGPVERNHVIVASLEWDALNEECHFEPIEPPEGDFDLPEKMSDKLRVFLGYAGWSKNQLEREIAGNSWLVLKPHPELLKTNINDQTWHRIMHGLGPMYRVLADAPEDATPN